MGKCWNSGGPEGRAAKLSQRLGLDWHCNVTGQRVASATQVLPGLTKGRWFNERRISVGGHQKAKRSKSYWAIKAPRCRYAMGIGQGREEKAQHPSCKIQGHSFTIPQYPQGACMIDSLHGTTGAALRLAVFDTPATANHHHEATSLLMRCSPRHLTVEHRSPATARFARRCKATPTSSHCLASQGPGLERVTGPGMASITVTRAPRHIVICPWQDLTCTCSIAQRQLFS